MRLLAFRKRLSYTLLKGEEITITYKYILGVCKTPEAA